MTRSVLSAPRPRHLAARTSHTPADAKLASEFFMPASNMLRWDLGSGDNASSEKLQGPTSKRAMVYSGRPRAGMTPSCRSTGNRAQHEVEVRG
jgi:hypothetical protein